MPASRNELTLSLGEMLLPVFQDLIKPQWRIVLEQLKLEGGLPVSELARKTGASYMAAKTHCEDLAKAGYVIRTRLPRTEVGRPEIFYSLSSKADALFPEAGVSFTLELLDELRQMYGDNTPDRVLFQYFQKRSLQFAKTLGKLATVEEKARKLVSMRTKDGCAGHLEAEPDSPLRIVEIHNPLQRIFERFPHAQAMETRMLEQLLGARLTRTERSGGREGAPRIVFEIH